MLYLLNLSLNAVEKSKKVSYTFDHMQKQIAMFEEKCDSKGCRSSSKILPEYSENDILTLYHNAAFMFSKDGIKELNATVVGSKEPVFVIVPEGKQLKTAKKSFDDTDGLYIVVILNQDIFSSSKGELYINLNKDMTASQAVLKNTTLFGDVWGRLKEMKSEGSLE